MKWIVTFLAAFVLVPVCTATVINVPADHPTIQAGIKAADEGDTVLVAEDHYYERIDFLGKSIHVASEYILDGDTLHIANTIIDADTRVLGVSDTGSVVAFVSDEDTNSVLQGLTLQNGMYGVYMAFSGFTVRDCIIRSCGFDSGYSVYASDGFCHLIRCHVTDTDASASICSDRYAHIVIDSCIVDATVISAPSEVTISSSTVLSVHVEIGWMFISNSVVGGVSAWDHGHLMLTSSEISGNILLEVDARLEVDSCVVHGEIRAGGVYWVKVSNSLILGQCSIHNMTDLFLTNCTVNNTFQSGIGCSLNLDNCIVSVQGEVPFTGYYPDSAYGYLILTCCDVYGFDSTLIDGVPKVLDTNNVFFLDPMFCDPASGDYHLRVGSPCLPENNDCDTLMGAFGVGCERVCGDIFGVDVVDIDDIVFFIQYLYLDGAPPSPLWVANVNCDDRINLLDIVYLINYMFRGGSSPCDPDGDDLPDC